MRFPRSAFRRFRGLIIVLAGLGLAGPLPAQGAAGLLLHGVAPAEALDPQSAARRLELILAADSTNVEAHWRLAVAQVDIGKQIPKHIKSPTRDSLYLLAEWHARRAVALAPEEPDAHFALSLAVGMAALTRSKREQVKYAIEVRDEAVRTLELDPRHDGALHILGRWHAEIERLSNIEEFFAKKFLGAKVFGDASWAEAARNLEAAVALRPDYIYHRLDLGEIYVEMKRYADARAQFGAIPALPTQDVLDHEYRQQAASQLNRIAGKD